MCYNCGCGIPDDDMGHPEAITEETLKKASVAFAMTVEDTKKEIYAMLKKQLPKED